MALKSFVPDCSFCSQKLSVYVWPAVVAMVWLKVPSEPTEPIPAAYVQPPSASVSIKISGPKNVEVQLPPSVQLLKLPVAKFPLLTRFDAGGGSGGGEELVTVTSNGLDAALVPAEMVSAAVKA